jgi:Protein of unknown function (DUF2878)
LSQKILINFVLFQIGWFACVLGAARQMPWLGVGIVIVIVIWHLWQARQPKFELALLLTALLIGGIFDQMLLSLNLVSYQAHGWQAGLVPAWILALWAVFVTTLNVSLRWMRDQWLVAILFGAIGGPLAYMGAEKLGAASLNALPASHIALSIGWAILTPLLLKISEKFDGFKS